MAAVATPRGPFHVLAVDDSLPDRKLIERLLKTSSFQVTAVDSGSKALRLLGLLRGDNDDGDDGDDTTAPPPPPPPSLHADEQLDVAVNLIITDYCMPGMTGYDLLKKMKESTSLRDIPVVIMSSENIPSRINRCLEEGADEFFLKPVRMSDMSKLKPHILKSRCKEDCTSKSTAKATKAVAPTSNSCIDSSRKRKAADHEILTPKRSD